VGKTPGGVDTSAVVGDDGGTLTHHLGPRWMTTDSRWMTNGVMASTDTRSSTIHNPYYCHCQNSIL